jgi:hypothetical protein
MESGVRHEAGNPVREASESAKATATELVTTARDVAESRAQGLFETSRETARQRLDGVARALRNASSSLEQDPMSATVRRVAERLEGVSRTLGERDLSGVLHDAEEYARREPAVFVGGAFALGFALSRFLKASSDRRRDGTSAMGAGSDDFGASYL